MRDPFGCWTWMGYVDKNGYAPVKAYGNRVPFLAHRLVYEILVGPIPKGLCLDHLCRNPSCVNPEHLDPVTQQTNVARGLSGVLKQTCAFGHPWNDENIRVIKTGKRAGKRYCRACHVERWNRR